MKILLARAQPGLGVLPFQVGIYILHPVICFLLGSLIQSHLHVSLKKDPVANLFYPDIIMTSHSIFPVRYMVLLISLYC
jgi:hypothetical protein